MAIKLLILASMLINYGDGQGGVHTDIGPVEVRDPDIARPLVATGAAMYVNRKDDPRKDGADTATDEHFAAVEAQIKAAEARAKTRDRPPANPPTA